MQVHDQVLGFRVPILDFALIAVRVCGQLIGVVAQVWYFLACLGCYSDLGTDR